MIVDVDREELFRELIKDGRPLVVDFYADWCGPCRDLKPVFKRLSKEFDGRLMFAKLNIDEFPELAKQAGVRSVPTLVVYKDGRAVNRQSGFRPDEALRHEFEQVADDTPRADLPDCVRPEPVGVREKLSRLFSG